ncbi:alcohol acetyltransferase [Penicillium taxi]|uniref:alcohol acetyltransferase n=1 Tax=Penicillium taxi TaxID=168475 RepID=UPI002545BD9A|nr:alcohol acetyltransferase [Penicillium taxi]KAJ5901855.1 alcohol acetyltransferase [Penicillium taxi]
MNLFAQQVRKFFYPNSAFDSILTVIIEGENDRRYIMRQALGFYGALAVTGLYTLHDANYSDTEDLNYFIPALKHCLATHPILGATIHGEDTEHPSFHRPSSLNLQNHLHLVDTGSYPGYFSPRNDFHWITQVTKKIHDQPFLSVDQHPPWKVCIAPISDEAATPGVHQMYIIFAYHHSHGDGKSGLAFHRSLLEGLRTAHDIYDQSNIYQPSALPLPPSLEDACNMTISWSYLLLNLLGGYMPSIAYKLFGFQPAIAYLDAWTGKAMCYDPANFHTGSEALLVENVLLNSVLRICRQNGVKFTGLFNQLVVTVLNSVLPRGSHVQNLLGQIVVDLRPLTVYTENQMVNSVSALYVPSTRSSLTSGTTVVSLKQDTAFWDAARATTSQLACCASTLANQPIGLLRYLSQFRPWFLEKLGKSRDSSYEISNAVLFDVTSLDSFSTITNLRLKNWDIKRVMFSQPANVTGSALNFQIVTRKDGDMVVTLNWQLGILGVPDEAAFVQDILSKIHALFTEICCH